MRVVSTLLSRATACTLQNTLESLRRPIFTFTKPPCPPANHSRPLLPTRIFPARGAKQLLGTRGTSNTWEDMAEQDLTRDPSVLTKFGTSHDSSHIVVGVIGAGANTRLKHIPNLQALQGVEIRTVCNRSIPSALAVAQQFNIKQVTDNWRDVIDDPEIEAVVIGTWPYMHAVLTIEALKAGKHVLCEARMAMDAREAHAMLRAWRERPGLIAQIVPSPVTLPYDAHIQDIIRSGKLGRLCYIEVRGVGSQFADPPGSTLHWRHNRDYSGLNILTMGIFYEALERWVGGASRVMAMCKTVVDRRADAESGQLRTVAVPDHVDVLCEMQCGAQAHMVFSAVTGAARSPTCEFWIYGTEGTLHLDLDDGRLRVAERGEGVGALHEVAVAFHERGHWRVEAEFVGAIRGTEPVRLTDLPTAVKYMEFTQAVAHSCQTGQAVALPLLPSL